MSKGRDRATLGQIFSGHSSGNPHVFCPCLPNLCWTHTYFPLALFRRQPQSSLASVRCTRQGEGHTSTPIHRL